MSRRVDFAASASSASGSNYKHGFGGQYGEFWIGNDMLHHLTSQRNYRLRIDMWDFEGGKIYAEFDTFRVDSEANKYKLRVRGFKGNCGNLFLYC